MHEHCEIRSIEYDESHLGIPDTISYVEFKLDGWTSHCKHCSHRFMKRDRAYFHLSLLNRPIYVCEMCAKLIVGEVINEIELEKRNLSGLLFVTTYWNALRSLVRLQSRHEKLDKILI
jgi:DNA-directed RNA polymerase subunit RPC12/RpoP